MKKVGRYVIKKVMRIASKKGQFCDSQRYFVKPVPVSK